MTPTADPTPAPARGALDRLLGLFSDVHAGEGPRAAVMLANIFLIMTCSYVLKTVREPLALTTNVPAFLRDMGMGQAEMVSYAGSMIAVVLMVFVPAYSWFASRVDHMKLVLGVTALFVASFLLFGLAVQLRVPYVGLFFFIWLGLFNMSVVAQFWSYANDIYTKDAGHRLFPLVGVGMTAGPPVGAWVAGRLFQAHVPVHLMLYGAGALLLFTGVLYEVANRGASVHHPGVAAAPIGGKGGFTLVFASHYIRLIAVLLILLNIVNTVGEYLLRQLLMARASTLAADPAFDQRSFIGGFYGGYYFWINVIAVLLQVFVTPRLVRKFGLTAVLFALPFVSLGAYGFVALGATLAVTRWAKTAENASDYSIMNTARQLLWLPTTREEKYKAKQAVDTFFVRLGDMTAGFVVFLGTSWLALGTRGFAALNLACVAAWLVVAVLLLRENHRLSALQAAAVPAQPVGA